MCPKLLLGRDNHRILKLCKLANVLHHQSRFRQQFPPVRLPTLLRVEHDLHGDAQAGRVLDAGGVLRGFLVGEALVVDDDDGGGTHGGQLRLEDADAGGIVVVVHDLTEIVYAGVCKASCQYNKDKAMNKKNAKGGEEKETGPHTLHRLLRQVIIAHLLHALHRQRLLQHLRSVLQHHSPFQLWQLCLERRNLLPVAAAHVHKRDLFRGRETCAHFRTEVYRVEPRRQAGKLRLHEPVKGALLDGVRLEPGVKVDGRVLSDLEGVELLGGRGEDGVERGEAREAVVMADFVSKNA